MSGVQFATKTYGTGFQKKDHGEDGDSRKKSCLFSKVFVTNLQFGQVRFFFNVSQISIFFFHTTVNLATGGVRREVRKQVEGTPAMDIELKGIRTHMYTDKRDIEQNTHP